jgi:AraC-like DNA-binding protein
VRLFRETYGQTPIKMLIDMRLEHACDLIANTEMPVAEIAAACGYSSASYFIAEYKKHFGITPLRQRQQPQ